MTERAHAAEPPANINKSTALVLRALSLFGKGGASYGVTALAAELGISKNMAFRALATLAELGYLVRDAAGTGHELGWRVLELRNAAAEDEDIRTICAPYMQQMQALTGESVFFAVAIGRSIITVDGIEARGRRVSRITWGEPIPLHVGSSSRVILANLSDAEIEAYIAAASPLQTFSDTTITDPAKLREEIALVRRRGYARGYQDYVRQGSNFIAFPVLDMEQIGRAHV